MTSVLWVGVQDENGTHPLEFQLNQGLPIILGICGNHLNHYLITTYINTVQPRLSEPLWPREILEPFG